MKDEPEAAKEDGKLEREERNMQLERGRKKVASSGDAT